MKWLIAQGGRRVVAAGLLGLIVALDVLGVLPVALSDVLLDVLRQFGSSSSSPLPMP